MTAQIIPAEDWPPYRWLWTHLVLARDPETGQPTPYTHGMRRHWALFLVVMAGVLGVTILWNARRFWQPLVAFAAGMLTGHVVW